MKSRLIGITLSFAAVIIIITVCFSVSNQSSNPQDIQAEQIIAANEIEQLTQMGRVEESAKKAAPFLCAPLVFGKLPGSPLTIPSDVLLCA